MKQSVQNLNSKLR